MVQGIHGLLDLTGLSHRPGPECQVPDTYAGAFSTLLAPTVAMRYLL